MMKQHIIPALRLTFTCILFFVVIYPVLIWGVAQAAPAKGDGEPVVANGKIVGYALEGQSFTNDTYFNGRPSAVGYNAAGSGGSNKGPSNPEYLQTVKDRIDTFLVHNPTVKKEQIPSELVTASGSGLDPDISPEAALMQIDRISKARNLSADKIKALVHKQIQNPIFGPAHINVLRANIGLDGLK